MILGSVIVGHDEVPPSHLYCIAATRQFTHEGLQAVCDVDATAHVSAGSVVAQMYFVSVTDAGGGAGGVLVAGVGVPQLAGGGAQVP